MLLLIRRVYFKKMIIILELPLERWKCIRLCWKQKPCLHRDACVLISNGGSFTPPLSTDTLCTLLHVTCQTMIPFLTWTSEMTAIRPKWASMLSVSLACDFFSPCKSPSSHAVRPLLPSLNWILFSSPSLSAAEWGLVLGTLSQQRISIDNSE